MDADGLLSTAEAAARLGVKPQTLYAYVSRGLLHRTVAMDGRSSRFDPAELDELKLGRSDRREGELRAVITTAITRVDDQGLLVRGTPLIDLVGGGASFAEVVEHLWQSPVGERWPARNPERVTAIAGLDGLRSLVAAASADDSLRHDLSPIGVRSAGRQMIVAMAYGLTSAGSAGASSLEGAVWNRLTNRRPSPARRRALEVALSLLVDHGLAASTFAARIAASVRADPYSVVSAGLGVLGGPLHGAASASVHQLLVEAARAGDAAQAVGDRLRESGDVPGYGHSVYEVQDPRYAALMAAVIDGWADDPQLATVYRVRDLMAERRAVLPNVDLALGSLTWLAGMDPNAGEIIFAIARTAGWIAHAIEEYGEAAVRFRPRARYVG